MPTNEDIAIVGLAVDVPGAPDAASFWDNLREGRDAFTTLDRDALLAAGESPHLIDSPNYVPAAALLPDYDQFDAEFFGFSPKEAAILDPQHRKFLETAWTALEQSGHPPETLAGRIGVFAGCGMGSYFYFNLCSNPDLVQDTGMFLLRHTGNDKDFLSTRASHVFNLTGPSVNVQTACSTSLVAVHYAAKSLSERECDLALAGGVTIELPQGRGYLFKENEILSPDGKCHAFDHRAKGTVFGSGAGVVALRRLTDARADGDHIWAVIKGSAINNDGAAKAGYLAPSVEGQAAAIRSALDAAQVPATTIDYVECHGTGTYLGDPIEISALTEAFRADTAASGFCKVGSVKTNIGHLDTAAGVAGLVKTAMALRHQQIPPSLGFEAPNPAIDFDASPFRVADCLSDWPRDDSPRRASVNALGVGGTNAHAILEEAPDREASEESDFPFHVLCLSGRDRAALDDNTAALAQWLRNNPDVPLADVAFTLKEGRRAFGKRRIVVAETALGAAEMLESRAPLEVFDHSSLASPDIVFMFPGGGAQYAGMARDLYETEPVFADWMDRGLDHLQPQLDFDLRALWLPEGETETANTALLRPSVQLPLIMITEYALAQLWMSWGIQPAALIGHSMGENTAACLAGVMRFEDCIDLVLLRGRLFDTVQAGGMLSVSLPEAELRTLIPEELDIASVNAPGLCAVSGPDQALDVLAAQLRTQEVDHQRIAIDIAAHSRMLDPILQQFEAFLHDLDLRPPQSTVISNRTGLPLSAEQATNPAYWVDQLRHTVHFSDGMEHLARENRVFLEVGPGKALSSLAQMQPDIAPNQVLSTLRHPEQEIADDVFFFGVIGRLWALGVDADWTQIWGDAKRHRLPLPTYAFQRKRYFIEPGQPAAQADQQHVTRHAELTDWGYRPLWRPRSAACDWDIERDLAEIPIQTWLIFEDDAGVAAPACDRLSAVGHRIIRVKTGDTYARLGDNHYQLSPEQGRTGYDTLLADLSDRSLLPDRIGHFWLVTQNETHRPGSSFFNRNQENGFYSLLYLLQALAGIDHTAHIATFTTGAASVRDERVVYPEKALIAGPIGVAPREMPGLSCSTLDLELAQTPRTRRSNRPTPPAPQTIRILEELCAIPSTSFAALRDNRRFEQTYHHVPLTEQPGPPVWTEGGAYLITGGFGGIGLTLAQHLITTYNAKIALLTRSPLPDRTSWDAYIARHGKNDLISRRISALRDLEAVGERHVIVLNADVCNLDQMRHAVDAATDAMGPLTGVIHAAGHIDDGPMLSKTEQGIQAVLAPKITGLQVLDQLFPDGALEQLILFSSSSTATRPAGQTDYVAANAFLNAYAQSRRNDRTRVTSVNWGVWAEVGMAANAMVDLTSPLSEPVPVSAPLIGTRQQDTANTRFFHSTLSTDLWVLDQHRLLDGTSLMPGTGYIDLIAQTLQSETASTPFEIRDLYFLRPLVVPDNSPKDMVARLRPDGDGFAFDVHSEVTGGYQLNAQASVELGIPTAAAVDLEAIANRCGGAERVATGERLVSPQEQYLRFGAQWHVLQSTRFGDSEGIAKLRLPSANADDLRDGYALHPGLLDLATGWAVELAPGYDGQSLWVPMSYESIRVYAPLPSDLRSWVRVSSAGDDFVGFDVTLTDAAGRICVDIRDFRMTKSDRFESSQEQTIDCTAADLGLQHPRSRSLSPDEQRLAQTIAQGIRPDEGPIALTRALATRQPEIVVSSLDLHGLIKQANQLSAHAPEAQSFDRPELESDYVAPQTPLEQSLAGLFETLLGISKVGVNDSFFDLGGHSLIAVRLFARIKAQHGADFPLSLLFEAPTVAALARHIQPHEEAAPVAADRKFTHLVPLSVADQASETPLFIVAGMFGNVLNLRQLGLLLGKDRPVYGLQARGLIGADRPHNRQPDAAAACLEEIRTIQPHGPYLLAGFSGGGITAYEMAHQLQERGEEIAALMLLDTPLPVRPALSRQDKTLIKLQEIRRKGIRYLGEWASNRLRWELDKRRLPDAPQQSEFNNAAIEAAFRESLDHYELKPWDGPLTLFRPPLDRHWSVSAGNWVSRDREYVFEDNDWTRWAPHTDVIEVPGDHDSMVLTPNVAVLADQMARTMSGSLKPKAPEWALRQAAE